ncbi:DUF5680 domain-containing protein [Ottowia thiooxydans]|uniref:DUF5680 domain-containing protein n=1 Tax=Ottowia thiooxydans TaxID=219182 RepID=UPI00048AA95B|nr:DUF5680 domain-containing protein [Ottowia thiooxydans]
MPSSLTQFLHAAKLVTYAGQDNSASVEPLLPSTKQFEFAEGDFLYRDIYAGMGFFVGQELVYDLKRPVWSMAYAGGLTAEIGASAPEIYRFLRNALCKCPPDLPVRGPGAFQVADFAYACEIQGSLDRFGGREQVMLAGTKVYELQFSGGFIR